MTPKHCWSIPASSISNSVWAREMRSGANAAHRQGSRGRCTSNNRNIRPSELSRRRKTTLHDSPIDSLSARQSRISLHNGRTRSHKCKIEELAYVRNGAKGRHCSHFQHLPQVITQQKQHTVKKTEHHLAPTIYKPSPYTWAKHSSKSKGKRRVRT